MRPARVIRDVTRLKPMLLSDFAKRSEHPRNEPPRTAPRRYAYRLRAALTIGHEEEPGQTLFVVKKC